MKKDNRKKNRKYGDKIFLMVLCVFAFINIGIITLWIILQREYYIYKILTFSMLDLTAIVATYYVIVYKKSIETDKVLSEYQECLEIKIKSERDEREKDVLELMLNNNKEIAEYFEISKKQEKFSYIISVGCAIVGVAMLIVSIGAVFLNERIETTIITAVSGAITELVSGIVLWIHNKSAMQLNFYYNSLHENEKFLSAIKMTDRIEDKDKKEQMYEEIIKAQIRSKKESEENEK